MCYEKVEVYPSMLQSQPGIYIAEKASTSRGTATTEPPPPQTEEQLERSRKLNSEGLEVCIFLR